MDEFLFRASRIDGGGVVEGDYIQGVGTKAGRAYILPRVVNVAYLEGCHHIDGYTVEPLSVVQYTGKDDRLGEKIFKGSRIITPEHPLQIVDFINGCCVLVVETDTGVKTSLLYDYDSSELEVL